MKTGYAVKKTAPQGKTHLVKARVTAEMKEQIAEISERRGESEGVIVREAIRQYLARKKLDFPAWEGTRTGDSDAPMPPTHGVNETPIRGVNETPGRYTTRGAGRRRAAGGKPAGKRDPSLRATGGAGRT